MRNVATNQYLYSSGTSLLLSSTLGTVGTSTYYSRVWRLANTAYYGNTSSYQYRELGANFSISNLTVNIGQSKTPSINKNPSNALLANPTDFTYSYYSGTTGIVSFNTINGSSTGQSIGIATYKATHKVTNRVYYFRIYVDRYTYELAHSFGFSENVSVLIRDLYNRVDSVFSSESSDYKAWHVSRLLSEFSYDGTTYFLNIIGINKWDDVAGTVTSPSNRKDYFVNILNYTEDEYNEINDALSDQHSNTQTSDFTHMQYSLAARLAYCLDLDYFFSNLYGDDEHVSYLAGWLGDATILNNGTTSFDNDDYMADLDAENLYRMIYNTTDSISAINDYYQTLSSGYSGVNRATIFKNSLSYAYVESTVLSELNKTLNEVRADYPDTYDFLMSLSNNLSQINHYQ